MANEITETLVIGTNNLENDANELTIRPAISKTLTSQGGWAADGGGTGDGGGGDSGGAANTERVDSRNTIIKSNS